MSRVPSPKIGQWVLTPNGETGRVFGIWPKRDTAAVGLAWDRCPRTGNPRPVRSDMYRFDQLTPLRKKAKKR